MALSARTGVNCMFLCAGSDPMHGLRTVHQYSPGAEAFWSQSMFKCTPLEAGCVFEGWSNTFGNKGEC